MNYIKLVAFFYMICTHTLTSTAFPRPLYRPGIDWTRWSQTNEPPSWSSEYFFIFDSSDLKFSAKDCIFAKKVSNKLYTEAHEIFVDAKGLSIPSIEQEFIISPKFDNSSEGIKLACALVHQCDYFLAALIRNAPDKALLSIIQQLSAERIANISDKSACLNLLLHKNRSPEIITCFLYKNCTIPAHDFFKQSKEYDISPIQYAMRDKPEMVTLLRQYCIEHAYDPETNTEIIN